MISKKTLLYWTVCSFVLVVGIHYLDGMPVIIDWLGFLHGVFWGILLLVVGSIVSAVVIAAYPFKSNRTPTKQQIRVFIPAATIFLTIVSFIAFIATRPSYAKSTAAEPILCRKVKEGYFLLDDYIIERKGNTQTETDRITREKSTSRVNWISDCEYELTNINNQNKVIKVKIISVTAEAYKCVAFSGNRTTRHELRIQNSGK
jgi:hypothetical protein